MTSGARRSAEKAAEDTTTEPETLEKGRTRPRNIGIQIPPRPEMFFRPEEVDGRSERVRDPASVVAHLSDPEYDAVGFRAWPIGVDGELQ